MFADLDLSKRLESAEGHACAQFADSRRRQFPDSGGEWMECAGAYAVFDTVDSPVTQTFGLGVFEELTTESLDRIEQFFAGHRAPVFLEMSPHAGVAAFDLLCTRGYRPVEFSNVMYRPVDNPTVGPPANVSVRIAGDSDSDLWTRVSARGWAQEQPELLEFLLGFGTIFTGRTDTVCFLAEVDGQPGAAGALCIHDGVALFAGSATVPELRRRGLQSALLHARMRYAFDSGCDIAEIVVHPGSDSQRNAERKGFRIAYTRTKWKLSV